MKAIYAQNQIRLIELPEIGAQVMLKKNSDGEGEAENGITLCVPIQSDCGSFSIMAELNMYYQDEAKRDEIFDSIGFEQLQKTAEALLKETDGTLKVMMGGVDDGE